MIKLTDYIMKRIVSYGVKDVFMISGGGAMHLVDSVGTHPKINYICTHHEQAAAIAAEGYSRVSGKLGVVVVTSGPGGTNTLTGVIGQWLDSVPVLYLSGQVKQETTIESCKAIGLRQLGDQEINIVDIVKPVTKYAAIVDEPNKIRYYLDKALYLAVSGRPGPVWLDIPLNIQSAQINEENLVSYNPSEDEILFDSTILESKISKVIEKLKYAKRPVIIAGNGIRISGMKNEFNRLIDKIKIPVVTTFNGFDLLSSDNKYFIGRIGTIGDRAGNFAVQNSDFVLSIGSRNNIRQISYNWNLFARAAYKVVVDIDQAELKKPTFIPDMPLNADVKNFLNEFDSQTKNEILPDWDSWLKWCTERKEKYPVVIDEYKRNNKFVQPYCFIDVLTKNLTEGDIVVAGNGTACVTLFQAGIVKNNQRFFWNSGCASMGYDLPAAIGACFASDKKNIICLAGDGSLQMNIQELQTVFHHQLPIKLFVLNNDGYISIKQTQDSFFAGRHTACDKSSGVSFPDVKKLALAYGIPYIIIDNQENMSDKIKEVINTKGSFICEVILSPDYKFAPKLSSEKKADGRMVSKPLEDMYPFLDRDEFKKNMIVPICEE